MILTLKYDEFEIKIEGEVEEACRILEETEILREITKRELEFEVEE